MNGWRATANMRGPDRQSGDRLARVGALAHKERVFDGPEFHRLPDGRPSPTIPNIRIALDLLGIKRGQRVIGTKLFAQMSDEFGLTLTPDLQRKTLAWLRS